MHPSRTLLSILPFWLFIFFFKIPASLHYTLLPILTDRVFPVWMAGLLIGGGAGIQMIFDVPAGFILDRFGYIRVLKISTACFLLGGLILLLGITPWTVITSIILATIGWLFFTPGMDAYILTHAPHAVAGRFMAARDVMGSAGVVAGMMIMPFVIHADPHTLALILSIPFCVSLLALTKTPLDTASVHAEQKISHQSFYIRRRFIHHAIQAVTKLNPVSTALVFHQFSSATFYGVVWFTIPLMIERMARTGALSFGLVVFDLAVLLTGFFLGRLTDTWSKQGLIFWGLLLFSLCGMLLGFHFGILFIVFGFLATTGDEMASLSLWAWLDHLDKEHSEDALVAGIMTLFKDLGWMVGPILAGLLFEPLGATWTIVIGASFIFITWLISTYLLRKTDKHGSLLRIPHLTTSHLPRFKPHKH